MTKSGVEKRLRLWQQRLGLATWNIHLDWGTPAGPRCDASILASVDYDSATLVVSKSWHKWTQDFCDRTLVHELMHVHLRGLESVLDHVEGQLHRDVHTVIKATHEHFLEQAAERLAQRFVDVAGCKPE